MNEDVMSTDQIAIELKFLRVCLSRELGDINEAKCNVAAMLYRAAKALGVSPARVLGYDAFTQLVYSDECPE